MLLLVYLCSLILFNPCIILNNLYYFVLGFIFVIGFIFYILNILIKIMVILLSEEMLPIIGDINKKNIKSLKDSFLFKKDDSPSSENNCKPQ